MADFVVDEMVIWHSPHTDEDVVMNYRGRMGDKAMLYNMKSGFQWAVPLDQIRKKQTSQEKVRYYWDAYPRGLEGNGGSMKQGTIEASSESQARKLLAQRDLVDARFHPCVPGIEWKKRTQRPRQSKAPRLTR